MSLITTMAPIPKTTTTTTPFQAQTLPPDLVNLLSLQSSFLTALSFHYAHNGTSVPIDVRALTPSIAQTWHQRTVTLDDLRILLGVLDAAPGGNKNPWYLSDYSGGKICLEIRDEWVDRLRGVDERALQDTFVASLEYLWTQWSTTPGVKRMAARPIAAPKRRGRPSKKTTPVKAVMQPILDDALFRKFLAQLPQAEITLCSSAVGVAASREKGRKRLREFKDSVSQGRAVKRTNTTPNVSFAAEIVTGKENDSMDMETPVQTKITEFASVRKSNLLDRILAKQNLAASLPTMSPAEAARQAALQKSEEVLGVLQLLCASKMPGTRVSFSMAALVQSLQGSIRSPLSREEVMKCVEVLAQEVAPGYLNIVKMGSMSSVVINQAMRPYDVKGRLAALGVAV
jgi:hypothetical protein